MPDKQFPVVSLFVEQLSQTFETQPDSDNPNIRKGTVTLPANATAAPIAYTIKVYANGAPTDVLTTVTVKANPSPTTYKEVDTATATPTELESTGGNVSVSITFKD